MVTLLPLPLHHYSVASQEAPEAPSDAVVEEVAVVETCKSLLYVYGREYGLSDAKIEEAVQTMRRESGFHEEAPNPTDSHRGSWGCAQINIDAHPHITVAQAQNKYFASRFMISEFAAGHERKWTCWREWYAPEWIGVFPKKHCPQQ